MVEIKFPTGVRRTGALLACCLLAPVLVNPVAAREAKPLAVAADLRLENEVADLRKVAQGQLPETLPLPALFEIDLTDPAAIAQRVAALQVRLGTSLAVDANEGLVERDRLRLAFLSLPAPQRNTLIEQDRLRRAAQALEEEHNAASAAQASSEKARDVALITARNAADTAQRELATEEARLLSHRIELSALLKTWASRNQTQLERQQTLLTRYADVDSSRALPSELADRRYREIRNDLADLREEADDALTALDAPSEVSTPAQPLALDEPAYAAFPDKRAALLVLRQELAVQVNDLRKQEIHERYADAEKVMEGLKLLQTRRVALLPMLSESVRGQVTGLNREGWARIQSELRHVQLMARWYPAQRLHQLDGLPSVLHDLFAVGRVGLTALSVVLLIVGYVVALRRHAEGLQYLRSRVIASIRDRALAARISRGFQTVSSLAPELLQLIAVYVLFDRILADAPPIPEVVTLRSLAYAWAFYALILAGLHRVVLGAVQRYRRVESALNDKIHRSLRLVTRFGLGITVYLIVAQTLLGRGALYEIAVDLAWAGALIIAYRLIRAWRAEVTGSYLNLFPHGALAALVRSTADRPHGLLIAVAAFGAVAARGLWSWLRDTALGFEQTRKALAYLLRRRLERQAEGQAGDAPDPSLLPQELQDALTEDPVPQTLAITRFPDQPEVLKAVHALHEGGTGTLTALVGERGAGKTTWMQSLSAQIEPIMPVLLHTLEQRQIDPDALLRALSTALGMPCRNETELIQKLIAGPVRTVMLDLGQNMILRTVGGLAGYEALIRVARATTSRVAWILAFSRWPFEYVQRTHPEQDVYDRVIRLEGWPESAISQLIESRMSAAGYTADYGDLLLETTLSSSTSLDAEVQRPSDRYHRIIWDYADGNPRVALHFWRYSLVPAGDKRVKVRLFASPPLSALETTALRTRFLLATLVQHENITAAEAAQALRWPLSECAATLEGLRTRGYLLEADGRYRVTCHWNRVVVRFLQRKKLLLI